MARTQPTLIGRIGFESVKTSDDAISMDLGGVPYRLDATTFPVRTIEEAGTTGSFTTLPGMTTVDVTAIGAARAPGGYQPSPGSFAGGGAGGGACVHHAAMPVFHPETVVCHGGYLGGPPTPLLESSWWRHPTTLMATYGQFGALGVVGGPGGTGGLGGLAAACIVPAGGTATNGGNGGNGTASLGGGGGGAGGTTTNGSNGITGGGGGAGGSLYGGAGNGGGGTGTPFFIGPAFPDTIGEYGGGGGGTDQATNDIRQSGRGRVRVEAVGFWDAQYVSADNTPRTISLFVDVGAASAIEVQDNMSYVGGFWVAAPGNVGLRIGGVQTMTDVESAMFSSTIVYLYNYGTKPLATFEDTVGATLVSTFVGGFPAVVADPGDLLVAVLDVTGGIVECAPTTIRVRTTERTFGDWNFNTFIGMTDVDVIAIGSGAAGGTTTTTAGGGGGGGGGGYAYGNCLVTHPESIPVHSGTDSDSWFRASTPSPTAVVAFKGLPGSGANSGAGGAGGGGGGGTGGGVFSGSAGGAGLAATFISVPLGFRGGGGGAGGAGGGPASTPLAGENCPAIGHIYTEPPPGSPIDNGWPGPSPSQLNYNFGGRGSTGGGLVATATPTTSALYVADGGYGGGHVQLVNPGGGLCLGGFNTGLWNRQFSAFGGGGGGGGNTNFPSFPTGGSAGNGAVQITGTGQWDAVFTALTTVGIGKLTCFVDTSAQRDIDIRPNFSFESGSWVASPGTLGLKITGLTTVADVEDAMTSFVSFSQVGVRQLATFEDTAGATLEIPFTFMPPGIINEPGTRWTELRINGAFGMSNNGGLHRRVFYSRAYNVSPASGNAYAYISGFGRYEAVGAMYIYRNVAENPFTTLDSLDDSRTQAGTDNDLVAITPSTVFNLTVDPTNGADGTLTERELTELFVAFVEASANNGTNFDQAVATPTSTPIVNYPTLVADGAASVGLVGGRIDLFHATPPAGAQPIANFVSSLTSGAGGAGTFQVIATAALLRGKLPDITVPYYSQQTTGWDSIDGAGNFVINTSNTIRRNDLCLITVDVTCDLPPGIVTITTMPGQGTAVLISQVTVSDTTRFVYRLRCTDTTTLEMAFNGSGWGAFPIGFAQVAVNFFIDVDTTNPIVHANTTSVTKALSATTPDGAFVPTLAPVAENLTDLLVVMIGLATIDNTYELPWTAPQYADYQRQLYSAGFPDLRPRTIDTNSFTIGGVVTYDAPLESITPVASTLVVPHAMTPLFTNPANMATVFVTSIVLRGTAGPTPPPTAGIIIINIITPTTGFSKSTPIIIDVYSTVTSLRRAWINSSYAGLAPDDMVHNGDRFGAAYQGSTNTRTSITNGYRFTLLRDGGWPGAPSIDVHAVDTFGNGDEP